MQRKVPLSKVLMLLPAVPLMLQPAVPLMLLPAKFLMLLLAKAPMNLPVIVLTSPPDISTGKVSVTVNNSLNVSYTNFDQFLNKCDIYFN